MKFATIPVSNDVVSVMLCTDQFEFLGSTNLNKVGDNIYEVDGPVARPTFGGLLYQAVAKWADTQDCFIASARDGDTRGAAIKHWEGFYEGKHGAIKIKLDDYLCEEIDWDEPEELQVFMHAYKINADKEFLSMQVDSEDKESMNKINKLFKKTDSWFGDAYGMDSNKWIDTMHPLSMPFVHKSNRLHQKLKELSNESDFSSSR